MEDQSELKLCEMGLPSPEDLMPTTQTLIPPELALAFGLTADTFRVHSDLNRVMHDNYSTNFPREENFDSLHLTMFPRRNDMDNSTRLKRGDYFGPDEVNSGPKDENGDEIEHNRAVKRPRLVWTPELHQRFVEVIERLGIDKAVPKTIMEMMNVDGLTRENVASHLQKYRLYLKRMEGGSSEGHSSARRDSSVFDTEGFGSLAMPVSHPQPPQQHRSSVPLMPMPMPMPMVPPPGPYGYGHLGLPVASAPPGYCGLESGAYSMFWNRQRG